MVTVIFAHPWGESFSGSVLKRISNALSDADKAFTVIDLYKDGFNPVLTVDDLKLFSKGRSADVLVAEYQKILKQSSELVFIFPLWWYDVPAILKGFFDKVFLLNFAYKESATGIEPLMKWINKATVITSSASPTADLEDLFGDPVRRVILNSTLKSVGINNSEWLNISDSEIRNIEKRENYLAMLYQKFC